MEGEADDTKKGACPVSMCSNLPLDRKVQVTAGAIIILLSLMSLTSPGFIWLIIVFGAGMIFGGLTGNCLLTRMVAKCCGKDASACGDKG